MTDLVQLQEDCTYLLLAAEQLVKVNVVQYRKLRLASVINLDSLWQSPRTGRTESGIGVLVEMPRVDVTSNNVSGPPLDLVIPFVVIEEPNINLTPDVGTLLSAEEVCQRLIDVLHLQCFGAAGTLQSTGFKEAAEFPAGLVAYRNEFKLKLARTQTPRCATPQVAVAAGLATLTTATAGAAIYYTTDGSLPGSATTGALRYTVPFAVTSGQTLRFAAWATGYNPSEIRSYPIA